MNLVEHRLIAGESESQLRLEEVVWSIVFILIHRIAVLHRKVDIGVMLTFEEVSIVGQITVASRDADLDRIAMIIVIAVVIFLDSPCIASGKAFKLAHGIEDGSTKFAPEARSAPFGVIEEYLTDTVGDFTDTDTAEGGGDKIVECGRLNLAEEFPLQRSDHGERC